MILKQSILHLGQHVASVAAEHKAAWTFNLVGLTLWLTSFADLISAGTKIITAVCGMAAAIISLVLMIKKYKSSK